MPGAVQPARESARQLQPFAVRFTTTTTPLTTRRSFVFANGLLRNRPLVIRDWCQRQARPRRYHERPSHNQWMVPKQTRRNTARPHLQTQTPKRTRTDTHHVRACSSIARSCQSAHRGLRLTEIRSTLTLLGLKSVNTGCSVC